MFFAVLKYTSTFSSNKFTDLIKHLLTGGTNYLVTHNFGIISTQSDYKFQRNLKLTSSYF